MSYLTDENGMQICNTEEEETRTIQEIYQQQGWNQCVDALRRSFRVDIIISSTIFVDDNILRHSKSSSEYRLPIRPTVEDLKYLKIFIEEIFEYELRHVSQT